MICLFVLLLAGSSLAAKLRPIPGIIGRDTESYIIGGSAASIAANPWQGSLRSGTGSHICGCVRITDRWVLTAAHCVTPSGYSIRFGSADRTSGGGVYQVEDIFRHPNYDQGPGSFPNDIAVLGTATTITHGGTINRASGGDFIGSTCRITGWGRTQVGGGGGLPTNLMGVNIPTMTRSQCESHWGNSVQWDVHICVGDGNVGSCNGDSGGPLVCDNQLVGLTSWGIRGCSPTYPSVYTRVSNYNSWISGICGC